MHKGSCKRREWIRQKLGPDCPILWNALAPSTHHELSPCHIQLMCIKINIQRNKFRDYLEPCAGSKAELHTGCPNLPCHVADCRLYGSGQIVPQIVGQTETITSGNKWPEQPIKGPISQFYWVGTKLQAFKSMGTGKTRRLMSRGVEGNLENSVMPEHDEFM
jgi:hypothetical protein